MSTSTEGRLIDQINAPGWPRPRAEVTVDGQTKLWPVPWMASVFADYETGETTIVLDSFDISRADKGIEEMLCQVCGSSCGETSYAPLAPRDIKSDSISSTGTPVCSVRCARLALAMCPHFKEGTVIASFAITDVVFDDVDTRFEVKNWAILA